MTIFGTPPYQEREDSVQTLPYYRMKDYGRRIFRFVRRILFFDQIFIDCLNEDGTQVIRAFRLPPKNQNSILDKIRIAHQTILKEVYPDKDLRPRSPLSRSRKALYLVIDRQDNQFKIFETNKTVHESIMEHRKTPSTKNPGYLKYGLPHMYDITVVKKEVSDRFKVKWITEVEYNQNSWDKIPIIALSEDYPTFSMVEKFLLENKKEIEVTDSEISLYMDKRKKWIMDGENSFDFSNPQENKIREIVDRYEKKVMSDFFTPDEMEIMENLDIGEFSFHDDETIFKELQTCKINLNAKDKQGLPKYECTDRLLETLYTNLSEKQKLLLAEKDDFKSLPEPKLEDLPNIEETAKEVEEGNEVKVAPDTNSKEDTFPEKKENFGELKFNSGTGEIIDDNEDTIPSFMED